MLHNFGMGKALGSVLRAAREEAELTQQEVAEFVGVSRAAVGQWEAGSSEPATENLIKACKFLGISLLDATNGVWTKVHENTSLAIERAIESEVKHSDRRVPLPVTPASPNDIPVLGVAVGGEDADFVMNGMVVDYVRRPIGLTSARDIYAIHVVGESMSPRFEPGDLLYVSSSRMPVPGDYVIVQLRQAGEGEPIRAFVKKLRKRGPPQVVLEQHNPADTLKFPSDQVESIHRVIPWRELIFGS